MSSKSLSKTWDFSHQHEIRSGERYSDHFPCKFFFYVSPTRELCNDHFGYTKHNPGRNKEIRHRHCDDYKTDYRRRLQKYSEIIDASIKIV